MYNAQMVLHVLASGDAPAGFSGDIRRIVRSADPYLPMGDVRPLVDALDVLFLPQRVASWVASLMGVFALLLATIGVYGITAYVVTARAREVGIRLALGATTAQIVQLVMRKQLVAPLVGIIAGGAIGVPFALRVSDAMAGVSPWNPTAFGGAPLLVTAIATAAVLLPIMRLLRGEPMARLRE
jgi:predicted lysophospholipase L1 biosynthesis ABC-type transport system permease subunit